MASIPDICTLSHFVSLSSCHITLTGPLAGEQWQGIQHGDIIILLLSMRNVLFFFSMSIVHFHMVKCTYKTIKTHLSHKKKDFCIQISAFEQNLKQNKLFLYS